jgi:putative intracellular protease/amidase
MTKILLAVTGARTWTLADGTARPTGFWPEELIVLHRTFQGAGFQVTLATPGAVVPVPDEAGFAPEFNGGSTEAGPAFRDYLESIEGQLRSVENLDEATAAQFDAVVLPGGHGPMEDLAVSASFGRLLVEFLAQGKIVGALCHGPAGLLAAAAPDGSWAFDGYQMTGFSNDEENQIGLGPLASWLLEDELTAKGGKFVAGPAWGPHVISDRNLHTGQNPVSSQLFADLLVKQLG